MSLPQLMGAGSIDHDTQVVYTSPSIPVGTFGVVNGMGYVWCSHTGAESLAAAEPLVSSSLNRATMSLATSTSALCVGATTITGITAGGNAITANVFADGYMMVVDGGGQGSYYRIRDHTAFTASTADGSVVLCEPIKVASDSSTEVTLIQNKYADPQQSNAFGGDPFIGVPNVEIPAGDTTTQYFWAQRLGYCPVFVDGTPPRGTSVMISGETGGRLAAVKDIIEVFESLDGGGRSVHALDQTPVVGQMATDAIDGEIQIVDLQNSLF